MQQESRRRQTTVEQLELLVDFLQQHQDLALGRVRSKEARAVAARLWRECSLILNAQGPARTSKEWAKVWNDIKCRIRAKLVSINANQQATGGGPSTAATLTPLEERVAGILGQDVGPIPNVRQDQFATLEDDQNNVVEAAVVVEQGGGEPEPLVLSYAHADRASAEWVNPQIASPTPSLTGQFPSPSPSLNETVRIRPREATVRQRVRRTAAQATAQAPQQPAQANRTSLDESRLMILKIESMRAEAALLNAQAQKLQAEGFKLLAESVDRFTRMYSRHHAGAPEED